MRKRTIARGDIEVSRLGLGTATWGFPGTEDDAVAQLRLFAESGGTLIDTAHSYGNGESERIIGDVIARDFKRDDFVLATKAGLAPAKPKFLHDVSRTRMMSQLEESLRRLRVEHIDLWQVHLWDDGVPLEETLDTMSAAITGGKVRAAGVCNYEQWQIEKATTVQRPDGRPKLSTLQLEYSLLQRDIEREIVPSAGGLGLGILPWGPLGRGVLTGKYLSGIPAEKSGSRFFGWYVKNLAVSARCARIAEEVVHCALELGVSPAAVALSWVRDRPGVVAPLVGARSVTQLAESLRSESLELPDDVRERLDSVSTPTGQGQHAGGWQGPS